MKSILILFVGCAVALFSCGGGGQSKIDQIKSQTVKAQPEPTTLAEAEANFKNYNGVGPISAFELPGEIDADLVANGKTVYEAKCTACHKVDKRFIGPAPTGIISRRNPSWIMNMIMNPEEMVQKDPIAKLLLMEYNGSPMANQNLTQEEARAVLEYFRTL